MRKASSLACLTSGTLSLFVMDLASPFTTDPVGSALSLLPILIEYQSPAIILTFLFLLTIADNLYSFCMHQPLIFFFFFLRAFFVQCSVAAGIMELLVGLFQVERGIQHTKKYKRAKSLQWVCHPPSTCRVLCPCSWPCSLCVSHPSFCFSSPLFLSSSAPILLSLRLVVHMALFVALVLGISQGADQPVGEVAFSSGFHEPFSCGQRCGVACKKQNKTKESYSYERLSAWNKKRTISGKRCSAFFLIPPPARTHRKQIVLKVGDSSDQIPGGMFP